MESLPSGIVTFLFSDIEGSTRRWMEDPSMGESLELHDRLTRDAIEADGAGRIVKHTGDGVMAVFTSPSSAVASAASLQRSFLVADWVSRPLRVRVGIHTAEAEPTSDDYFGPDVSKAARVMGAAHGGQILVSGATAVMARGHLPRPWELRELGSFHLPDIDEPTALFQVAGPTIPDGFPRPRSLETNPTNLPSENTSFIGRGRELEETADLLLEHRLVTLTGVGGAGKTRLATRVAKELLGHFPDGVWYVPLAATTDADAVAERVAEVLDASGGHGADRIDELVAGRRMLVVLDNCEHLLDEAARVADRMARSPGETHVLATSREALGVGGEATLRVPSLTVEASGPGEVGDAVALFVDRARSTSSGFELSDETHDGVVEVCRRLDGIPLAIELAAARVGSLGLEQVRSRLDERFRILTGGSRTALPRQRTLAATIDWSYRLLDEPERDLLARLSVFVGGFTLEAAEAVCSDADLDVLVVLPALVDKSMVVTETGAGGAHRYRLLETIRQFAADHLDDETSAALRERHLHWYLEWLDRVEWSFLLGGDGHQLPPEAGNIQAAMDWSRDEDASARLAHAAGTAAIVAGERGRALDVTRTAIHEAGELRPITEALLRSRLSLLLVTTDTAGGEVATEASAAESLLVDQPPSVESVIVLTRLSAVDRLAVDRDPADAVRLAEQAVAVADAMGGRAVHTAALLNLSRSLAWNGQPEEAEDVGKQVLDLAEGAGDHRLIRQAYDSLLFATAGQPDGPQRKYAEQLFDLIPPDEEAFTPAQSDFFWMLLRLGRVEEAARGRSRYVDQHDLEGWDRVGDLIGKAMIHWMRGELDRADTTIRVLDGEPFIKRWAHDQLPLAANIAADRGELDRVREIGGRYLGMEVDASEVPLLAGVVLPHVRAEVESRLAGGQGDLDLAEASLERVREPVRTKEHHLSIQMEPPSAYLAIAEAELSRVTGPAPDVWRAARAAAVTEYWRVYTTMRTAEAEASSGQRIEADLDGALASARAMGARRLVEQIQRVPDGRRN